MKLKTFLSTIGLLAIIFSLVHIFSRGWLIYHDGPYMGKVVDAETNEPLKGSAVLGIWDLGLYGSLGGPFSKFFDAKETVTDENGDFEVPSVVGFHWWPFAYLEDPMFIVFKSGYDSYPPNLPIVTTSFTQEDFKKAHKYRLGHVVDKNYSKELLIRLSRAKNIEERKWVVSNIHLIGIPDEFRLQKAKKFIEFINGERNFLDLTQDVRRNDGN